jgi:hypothetical protein
MHQPKKQLQKDMIVYLKSRYDWISKWDAIQELKLKELHRYIPGWLPVAISSYKKVYETY